MEKPAVMRLSYADSKEMTYGPIPMIHSYLANEGVYSEVDHQLPVENTPGKMQKFKNSDALAKLLTLHLSGNKRMAQMDDLDPNFLSPDFRSCVSYHTIKERILELQEEPEVKYTFKDVKDKETNETKRVRVPHVLYTQPELNEKLLQFVIFLKFLDKSVPLILDGDVTCINSQSKDARWHYQRKKGYAPFVITCNGIPIYVEMRTGNISPSLFIGEAMCNMVIRLRNLGFTINAVRLDSAGYVKKNVDMFEALNVTYVIRATKSKQKVHLMAYNTVMLNGRKVSIAVKKKKFGKFPARYIYNNDNPSKRTVAIITNDFNIDPLELIQLYRNRGTEEQTMRLLKEFGWTPLIFHKIEHNAPYLIYSAMSMLLFKYVTRRYSALLSPSVLKANCTLRTFRNKILNVKGKLVNNQLVLSDSSKRHIYDKLMAA